MIKFKQDLLFFIFIFKQKIIKILIKIYFIELNFINKARIRTLELSEFESKKIKKGFDLLKNEFINNF